MNQATPLPSRFATLQALLAHDPGNVRLLADTAEAAFGEDQFEAAEALIVRHQAIAPLPPETQNLAGLVAMRLQAWDRAAERFEVLMAEGADAPAVRFNLAWSLAMAKRFDEALPLLDEATSAALPQAAQLEVQLLHEFGDFDRAAERGRALIVLHADHRGLNAAVSTLAIDVEDVELAAVCARRAGDHPEALTTLGTLALAEDKPEVAEPLFDAALARNPQAARAWVGRGLARLLTGDKTVAAQEIDRGAELFGTHLGSWIAAGWAYLIAGDRATARVRFETALALDDTFAESQGSIAVIDLLEGRTEEARKRTMTALRLDRQSFSAALASMLLAAGAGDREKARHIFETALNTPIDFNGRTVAQSIARLGGRLG